MFTVADKSQWGILQLIIWRILCTSLTAGQREERTGGGGLAEDKRGNRDVITESRARQGSRQLH